MRLRTRLMVLSVSTVAVIVTALFVLHLSSLTKTWLESAVERSLVTGKLIQSVIFMHITDSSASMTTDSIEETKSNWTRIVSEDKDLADRLVEQAAMPNGVIVQINIIGENGAVILSSIPSQTGHPAPVRQSLASIQDAGFLDQLSAIAKPAIDYETRIPLGILSGPDQQKPVFQRQNSPGSEGIRLRRVLRPARRGVTRRSFRPSGAVAGQTYWKSHRYSLHRQTAGTGAARRRSR
jgi:hypothetical protein